MAGVRPFHTWLEQVFDLPGFSALTVTRHMSSRFSTQRMRFQAIHVSEA